MGFYIWYTFYTVQSLLTGRAAIQYESGDKISVITLRVFGEPPSWPQEKDTHFLYRKFGPALILLPSHSCCKQPTYGVFTLISHGASVEKGNNIELHAWKNMAAGLENLEQA